MPVDPARSSAPPSRPALASRWLTAVGLIVGVAVLAVGSLEVLNARRDAWTQASHASDNLRIALSRDIARNLGVFDLTLRGVIGVLAEPGIEQVPPNIRRRALFDTSAGAEDLGAILILDETGGVVEDSTSVVPHRLDLHDRDYFQVHRDRADAGLFVSRPYRSRIVDGDLRISLSRRLPAPDGRFVGIVEGALRLAFFDRMFRQFDLGPGGSIALLRDDGRILARYPSDEAYVDKDVSQTTVFRRFQSAEHGQFVANAATDGVERLYAFGRVPGLPLILTVNRATEDILAPWRHRALLIAPVLAILFTAAVTSSLLFRREIRRRTDAEADLRAANDDLAALATTDGLTGIANRRAFDIALDKEWRRAGRDRTTTLALLLVDVDHFKAFNDSLGHPAGDRVLRAVAQALDGKVGRGADLVARYGGEEFAVLLPQTDLEQARFMAERMRAAVYDLDIAHPGSRHERVTVSIGVASVRPVGRDGAARLVEAADHALYAAKRGSRNAVEARVCDPPGGLALLAEA